MSPEERNNWFDKQDEQPLDIQQLQNLDEVGSSLWLGLLAYLFHPDRIEPGAGDPFVLPLINVLTNTDHLKEHAFTILSEFLELPGVLDGWTHWSEIDNTEEIYVRLKLLSRLPELPVNIVPFIQFFFRSSNTFLYQEAAITMGRHLANHPEFIQLLHDYAEQNDVPPSGPLSLNGHRSRRRILLVLTVEMWDSSWPW